MKRNLTIGALLLLAELSASSQTFGTYKNPVNGAPVARVSFMRSQWSGTNFLRDPTLIAYWPLASAADQAYDFSGNALNSAFLGSTSGLGTSAPFLYFVGGTYGGHLGATSYYLNHSNPNKFLSPSFTIPASAFTVSAWVYGNTSTLQYATIMATNNGFTAGNGFFLGLDSTGTKFDFIVNEAASNTCSSAAISVGKWYMVTATLSGTVGNLYVNGSPTASSPCAFTAPTLPSQPVIVGCDITSGGLCNSTFGGWNGMIQGVRVYSRALGATEIAAIYNAENTPH